VAEGPFPRSLSPREAEILDFLLTVDDPRVEPLREQRRTAVVTGTCTCGCASVDLAVDRLASRPATVCSPVLEADLRSSELERIGPDEAYGLLIFLDEGWLSLLEIWWIEKPPPEFPPASAFEAPRVMC
jgi:hypothetical protein